MIIYILTYYLHFHIICYSIYFMFCRYFKLNSLSLPEYLFLIRWCRSWENSIHICCVISTKITSKSISIIYNLWLIWIDIRTKTRQIKETIIIPILWNIPINVYWRLCLSSNSACTICPIRSMIIIIPCSDRLYE